MQYEVRWFVDEGISGKTLNRPGLQALIAATEAKEVHAVLCFRLDRISRNAADAMRTLLRWMKLDVEFFATSQSILQLGKSNPLRLTITSLFAEMAELEREAIVSRVKAGLAAAKARGVKLGRQYRLTQEQMGELRTLRDQGNTCRQLAKHFGISHSTAARMAKETV